MLSYTEKTKTLNYEKRISRHFLPKKRKKRAQKRKKKSTRGKKKGQKPRYFSFFQGETISTQSFLPDARALSATRLWCANTHTHTKTPFARRIRSKEKVRDATLSFFRARFGRISLSRPSARAYRFLESALSFLSLSREKKEARRTPNTPPFWHFQFARKERGNAQNETRRKPRRIAASFARDERNVARFFRRSSFRAFSLSPIARESWSVGRKDFSLEKKESALSRRRGEGVRVTSQKKKTKKRGKKTDCLGYQTDTKNFFSRFSSKKRSRRDQLIKTKSKRSKKKKKKEWPSTGVGAVRRDTRRAGSGRRRRAGEK